MDFALLSPEVNSALMYPGAGAGPMLASAAAWEGLDTELAATAASYQSVIAALTAGPWQGPAWVAMAAAAATHVTWLNGAAAQAGEAGAQAAAAAGAYEAAFAATVPPAVIEANRALLTALVATNFLGQNTPAIMATEALYVEMWAQDASTMYGYAGASAAASTLTQFTAPTPTANPAGLAAQAAAVGGATGTSMASDVQTTLSQLIATVPGTLQSLATPLTSTTASPDLRLSNAMNFLGLGTPRTALVGPGSVFSSTGILGELGISSPANALTTMSSMGANSMNGTQMSSWVNMAPTPSAPAAAGAAASAAGSGGVPAGVGGLGAGAPVSASLGNGASLGRLSVPPGWTPAAPTPAPALTPLPQNGLPGGPPAAGGPGSMLGGTPLAGTNGRNSGFGTPRYGFQVTVMARPPAAG
jgi:PPE-repeat protein